MKASQKLVCVFVDCDWGKKNKDLSDKYGVRGYPTVVFTDPDGKEVERLSDRSAGGVTKQIEGVAQKYTKAAFAESIDKAVDQAKEDKKPVLLLFATAKDDSKKLEEALLDDLLKDLREKFVLAKGEIKSDNADAKKYHVASSTQPVIFVIDPNLEKPEEKPLKKLTGKKSAKELKTELEGVVKKWDEKKDDKK